MLSKWIKEIKKILDIDPFYGQMFSSDIMKTTERIDNLLRRAALETDNEVLYDEIMAEIRNSDV